MGSLMSEKDLVCILQFTAHEMTQARSPWNTKRRQVSFNIKSEWKQKYFSLSRSILTSVRHPLLFCSLPDSAISKSGYLVPRACALVINELDWKEAVVA
jgi:hypothetical protein